MTSLHHPHSTAASPLRDALDDSTSRQVVVWAVCVAGAAILVVALAVRLWIAVDLARWWVPFALLAGIAAADLASGLVHWTADTWGRADLPVIGPRLLVPFRVHHRNPDDFLRRRFLDTNGDVAAISLPMLSALLLLPLGTPILQALALSGFTFCAFGALTNQIHQWAHMPAPPPVVRRLQRLGLLLGRRAHAVHHAAPYNAHYCITTGWCNGLLEAAGFFPRLEALVTRVTGAQPRADEQSGQERHV